MTWKCPVCGREFSRVNQDHYCVKPKTIDEYIAQQDEKIKPVLDDVRRIIKELSASHMTSLFQRI